MESTGSAANRITEALCDSLTVCTKFLAKMVQLNLITIDQNQLLLGCLQERGPRKATQLLIQLMPKSKRADVTSKFVEALKQSGDATNALLADLIEGRGNIPEYPKERKLIEKHFQSLQKLNPTDVLPYLTYIDPEDQHNIMRKCESGEIGLARTLLLQLTMRTLEQGWFETFLNALEETGHRNLARLMRADLQSEAAEEAVEESLDLLPEEPSDFEDTEEMQHEMEIERDRCRQSQTTTPPTNHRSRSHSISRHGEQSANARKSSKSPRRPQPRSCLSSGKRSKSSENSKQGTNRKPVYELHVTFNDNKTVNTVSITNSRDVKAMVGGEGNTMHTGSHPKAESPQMPGTEAELNQNGRPCGEDQPDHARGPRKDDHAHDVYASPPYNGFPSPYQGQDFKTEFGQGDRTRWEDQPVHATNKPRTDSGLGHSSLSHNGFPHRAESSTVEDHRPSLFADQLELAEDAVRGRNTVLVAPTGSGKTHVAAYIIHDHFVSDRPRKPVKDRRALFLVNTVNLVEQQWDKLKNLLKPTDLFSVIGIHGASELSIEEEVASKNVIVLTAQLLENALSYIPLDYFSLLVFDECHLCQKGHAYNTIMSCYLDQTLQGKDSLPQVVGMTASLGTGKAKSQSDANSHAAKICANMNAHSISMVERNIAVLKERVSIPKEVEPIEVRCRSVDPFVDKINEIMEKIERMLQASSSRQVQRLVNVEKVPVVRGSQAYRQWCDRTKRGAQIFIKNGQEELYRMLRTSITHLMEYNTALLINKQVRTKDAFNHLAKMMDTMNDRRGQFDNNDRQLWNLFVDEERSLMAIKDDPSNENPLLSQLSQIIQEEYRIRPHSRAILFVKTIDTTEALQDWITEAPELQHLNINPGRIAGSRDMTSKQQNAVMGQFRKGQHKMLVATNLLEQGTDVPACNLVIRLDYIPSDFGHVQIKGRNRAKDGRSYLITLVDSKGAARDAANRQRETMMTEAARHLKAQGQREFREVMRRQQDIERTERQAREEQKQDVLRDNVGQLFVFCCINCSMQAFLSCNVRVFSDSQYLIIDPDFVNRMQIKEHPKPKKLRVDMTIVGKMYCIKCGHDWGSLTRIKASYYSSVKIARFSLKNLETDEARTYKKWKHAPFDVEKITELPQHASVNVPVDVLKKLKKL